MKNNTKFLWILSVTNTILIIFLLINNGIKIGVKKETKINTTPITVKKELNTNTVKILEVSETKEGTPSEDKNKID